MFNLFKKKEKDSINNWLWRLNANEKIPSEINSYFLGIFDDGSELYLIGSKMYDKDDQDDEWACFNDFVPKEKGFLLGKQFKKIDNDDDGQKLLSKITDLIKEFTLSEKYDEHFLSKAEAIGLGFNGGDLVRIK